MSDQEVIFLKLKLKLQTKELKEQELLAIRLQKDLRITQERNFELEKHQQQQLQQLQQRPDDVLRLHEELKEVREVAELNDARRQSEYDALAGIVQNLSEREQYYQQNVIVPQQQYLFDEEENDKKVSIRESEQEVASLYAALEASQMQSREQEAEVNTTHIVIKNIAPHLLLLIYF